ncbi:MAG: hypothetical protein UT31_C0029G0013 [Parcubacteria group bacterium GW2011_GWF2_39_13b]|nr:MAG: hypothetical protein UT31_C0029G0013 [Parcubacteria group bacterium GW2011_GWF2_39_13b]
MAHEPWKAEDWRIREALRSAEGIENLFCVYQENREYILKNRPEFAKFALRVFWQKFCRVPDFRFLIWANEATYYLPDDDPVRREIKNTFLDQIKVNYNFSSIR